MGLFWFCIWLNHSLVKIFGIYNTVNHLYCANILQKLLLRCALHDIVYQPLISTYMYTHIHVYTICFKPSLKHYYNREKAIFMLTGKALYNVNAALWNDLCHLRSLVMPGELPSGIHHYMLTAWVHLSKSETELNIMYAWKHLLTI